MDVCLCVANFERSFDVCADVCDDWACESILCVCVVCITFEHKASPFSGSCVGLRSSCWGAYVVDYSERGVVINCLMKVSLLIGLVGINMLNATPVVTPDQLLNQVSSGKERVDRVYVILRGLPDRSSREAFVGAVLLNAEESLDLALRREKSDI